MFKKLAQILFLVIMLITTISSFKTQAKPISSFDHAHKDWDEILKEYVTLNKNYNRFDYKRLKKNLPQLIKYTKSLSGVSKSKYKSFSRDQKLAFLINSYNAFTVKVITENYPIKSITKLGFLGTGPWGKKDISFLDTKFSLNMIEKDYMIKKFKEARIHFAINCASVGCPSIQNFAFTSKNLENQLEASTKSFVENQYRYSYNQKDNELEVSKIFDWYKADFTRQYGSVSKFFAKYLENKKLSSATIDYKHYSWDLNQ